MRTRIYAATTKNTNYPAILINKLETSILFPGE